MNPSLITKTNKIIFYIFFIVYLSTATYLAHRLNIYVDESYSLKTAEANIVQAAKTAILFEEQPPFYFMVLSIWKGIDDSILFARILSIIFVCLSTVFLVKSFSLFDKKINSYLVAAVFLLNPIVFWSSLEIRSYALILLLSCLLLYYFIQTYYLKNISLKNSLIFIIAAIISAYTSYFLIFVILGFFIALVTIREFKTARLYFTQMLFVAAASVPLIFILFNQLQNPTTLNPGNSISMMTAAIHIGKNIANQMVPSSGIAPLVVLKLLFIVFLVAAPFARGIPPRKAK